MFLKKSVAIAATPTWEMMETGRQPISMVLDYCLCTWISGTMPTRTSQDRDRLRLDVMYPMGYIGPVMTVRETRAFRDWISALRDARAQAKVNVRIRRLSLGNPGDRVYYTRRGDELVILLVGGDKSTQESDIAAAKALARELED
jgi:putative component of toxin-antitoxin plasmid stabilization module